ncbi:cell division protein FtsW [Actinomyces sp. 2119]|nr:cell division protein FtsW [Actinomyces sp. 2119]
MPGVSVPVSPPRLRPAAAPSTSAGHVGQDLPGSEGLRSRLRRWRPWSGSWRRSRPDDDRGAAGGRGRRGGEQATLTYYALLLSTLVLLTLGLVMVFSVQSVTVAATGGNPYTDFAKYLVFAVVGVVGMLALSRVPLSWFPRLAWVMLVLTMGMQLLVFSPVGVNVYGNRNWIQVPGIGTAQPSEPMKLALALALGTLVAWYAQGRRGRAVMAGWVMVALAVLSVMAGQDLGTVIVLVLIVAGALWVGGLARRWFAALGCLGLLLFMTASLLSVSRRARILAWLRPDGADPTGVGYQPRHGQWALGTGGWFGVGPGSSRQKWGYLTQADSDYVFAVLGEEFGLLGTLTVIALFAVIGGCCLRTMRRHTDPCVVATASAIGAWVVGQALINMMVVTGILPVLGLPLPLVSRGGTALVSVLLAMGVLLAFARHEPGAQEALRSSPGALRRTLSVIVPRRNRA